MENFHKKYLLYLTMLEERLKKNPNDYDALLRKGIICCDNLHRYEESEIMLNNLIEQYPNNIAAYYWQAECLGYTGDVYKIKAVLENGLLIDPNSAECHYLLANVLNDFDPNDPLIDYHYEKAIALQPTWPAPRYFLIQKLIKQKKISDAQKNIHKALDELTSPIKIPDDPIDSAYETFITGRCAYNKNDFIKLLDKSNNVLI